MATPVSGGQDSMDRLETQTQPVVLADGLDGARAEGEPLRRPRVANVNVPERIVICLDVCFDEPNSLFKLGDGTTFTHLNMLKRVLEFFLHTKHAINPLTQFALVALRDRDARWLHGFTSSVREFVARLDAVSAEESTAEEFDLGLLLETVERNVEIPSSEGAGLVAPPFVLRLLVLYGRSTCVPRLPAASDFLHVIRRHLYVYTDILLAHEEDCALYRCEEVYDALQDLDNGYSYVFEVSRNATKIHDHIAKLLAHPLQRPLQKCADYSFPARDD